MNRKTKRPTPRPSGLPRRALARLVAKWRRKQREYSRAVEPEWKHGDKYASRRYEGESIAFRWCAEDLKRLMIKQRTTYFTVSRRQWRKMPPKTKRALVEMVKFATKAYEEGKLPFHKTKSP